MIRRAAAVAGLAGVLGAAGARRPVIRRWPRSIVQAALCMPYSEFPWAMSVLHAAVGAAALLRGSTGAAAANGAALAALAGLLRDADRSAAVLATALAELGEPVVVPRERVRIRPGRVVRRRYLRAADLAYGDRPEQRLDVWARPDLDATGRAPVLVQVHGGGWTMGSKAVSAAPLLAYLAERGWVCVSIDYRLAPGVGLPEMLDDVHSAIAWTRATIARFGGDPGFVAISGGSAGGHLAALAALTAGPGEEVVAAVPLYGPQDFSVDEGGLFALLESTVIGTSRSEDHETWQRLSPLHRAGRHAPPFFVVHGSADTIAAVGQSRRFVRRLREVSHRPVLYAELPRAQHGFDGLPTRRTGYHVWAVHRFLSVLHDRFRDQTLAGATASASSS